jgi:hypothetical protein
MSYALFFRRSAAILIGLAWSWGSTAAQQNTGAQDAGAPETVMVTLHAKPGSEEELARVIASHWATARQMKLVRDSPHVSVRGMEDGNKAYFMEIFTWRDAQVPDAAPPEIRKIWDDMNRLAEARDGHAGLEFVVVSVAVQ